MGERKSTERQTALVTDASQGLGAAIALESARAVRYLASPQAAHISGQTLVLDGGLTSY